MSTTLKLVQKFGALKNESQILSLLHIRRPVAHRLSTAVSALAFVLVLDLLGDLVDQTGDERALREFHLDLFASNTTFDCFVPAGSSLGTSTFRSASAESVASL